MFWPKGVTLLPVVVPGRRFFGRVIVLLPCPNEVGASKIDIMIAAAAKLGPASCLLRQLGLNAAAARSLRFRTKTGIEMLPLILRGF
jgi:hypothetical protein